MISCLECRMKSPDTSTFCPSCGQRHPPPATHPTRTNGLQATELFPPVTPTLLSESSHLSSRPNEDDEPHGPMVPPLLLLVEHTVSASAPMVADTPHMGNVATAQSPPLQTALSCAAAAKLALAPLVSTILASIVVVVSAVLVLHHLLNPADSPQVNTRASPRQHASSVSVVSRQTDCLTAGQTHVQDQQRRSCNSGRSTHSGDPRFPQQPAVVRTSQHLRQVQHVLSKSVSTVQHVVHSTVKTTPHLPRVQNALSKSVSTVQHVVHSSVKTTLPTVQHVVHSIVKTVPHLPKVGSTLSKSVSTVPHIGG
jgi:hypothetical protein